MDSLGQQPGYEVVTESWWDVKQPLPVKGQWQNRAGVGKGQYIYEANKTQEGTKVSKIYESGCTPKTCTGTVVCYRKA